MLDDIVVMGEIIMETLRIAGIFLLLSALATYAQAEEMMVNIEGFAFQPPTLTATPGTIVTWTNQDNTLHTVTSGDGTFVSGNLNKGQEFSFNFTKPGVYDYHCSIHPSMRGEIKVISAQGTAPPAAAAQKPETNINQTSMPAGAGQQQPGFGAALALAGILAVAIILLRKS